MRKSITSPVFTGCIIIVWSVLLCSCSFYMNKQNTSDTGLDRADEYYRQGLWDQAIDQYKLYLSRHPGNRSARTKLAKTFLAGHQVAEAHAQLESLIRDHTELPVEVYFLAGRSSHQLGHFEEAEVYYRTYLDVDKDADLNLLSYYLKQTGAAKTAGVAGTSYLVENVGKMVNTSRDEFRPVYSPNVEQRFYFSIHDPERLSPIRSTLPVGPSMKYAEVVQGTWAIGGALDKDLMPDEDLYLLDFSEGGEYVVFTRQLPAGNRMTYRKNFEELSGEKQVVEWTHPVYKSSLGDRDLFMIHDSAYLFSSERLEGYGGYDLFVTFKRLGNWMVQNLGPVINSRYDEITPFLGTNGRELYFSSNSDKSIGGYDIFFANFDDEMESWSSPQNMLPPLNSGMDDVGFWLSTDGREALFSSERQGGHGGFDIYQVYFDQQRYSQSVVSQPKYFYQVSEYRSFASQGEHSSALAEKPVYELPIIYFGERPVVITPKIRAELDQVLNFGKLFPHTGLLLQVFSGKEVENDFSFFKPVLILKNVVDYLIENGMEPSRMQIRLYGNQYPRFTPVGSSNVQKAMPVLSLNQRLEFGFTRTSNLPVQFGSPAGQSSDNNLPGVSPYQKWLSNTQNLYFRIKLLETEQLLKGVDYLVEDDYMLAMEGSGDYFTYFSGIFHDVASAKEKLNKYIAQGFGNAEIVAFIGASRIASDQITTEMIETYPILKEYIIYQK